MSKTCARCRKNGLIKLSATLVEKVEQAVLKAHAGYLKSRAAGNTHPRGVASLSVEDADLPYGLTAPNMVTVVLRALPEGAAGWFVFPSTIELDPDKCGFYGDQNYGYLPSFAKEAIRHELRHYIQFLLGQKGKPLKAGYDHTSSMFSRWGKPAQIRGMPPRKARGKDELSKVIGGTQYAVPWAHAVRDIEFHTRLGDALTNILADVRAGYYDHVSDAVRHTANNDPTFRAWKEHAPAKYRAGLSIAAAEIQKAFDTPEAIRSRASYADVELKVPVRERLQAHFSHRARKAQYAAVRKAELDRLRRLEAQAAEKARQEATARKALTDQLSGQMKTRAAQAVEIRRENDPFGRPAFFVYRDGKKTTKYAYSKEKAMKLAGLA